MSYTGMTGGFGRAMSRSTHKPLEEGKKPEHGKPEHEAHGHSSHATIRKQEDGKGGHHFTVEHEHGTSGPHGNFRDAMHSAGEAMGESVDEPSEEDVPIENALGMVKDGMGGDD